MFSDIFDALLPSETAKRKWYLQEFCVILKLDLNVLECHFLCVIHGPQWCMKWMNNASRCWNLCFCTILWCFNPIDTTHLFMWGKITPFGCGVMSRLWVQTLVRCLWQSLYNLSGHLPNTQRHRMTIKNLIIDGQVNTFIFVFRKQNNVKTPLSEMKLFASQYNEAD